MKKLILLTAALALLALPATALAGTFTFTAPTVGGNSNGATDNTNETDYNGGANQFTLDHHYAYTWELNGLNSLAGQNITSASITFKDIANWDTNANKLFVHLLNVATNGATNNQVASFQDNPNDANISDYFAGANTLGPSGLGPDNTKLFEQSFNMVGQGGYIATNFTYTFTATQLLALTNYINASQNIAFGFDPDCHYWNNGIVFTYTTAPSVPEPTTMVLLASGLSGLYIRRRRSQKVS